MNPDEMRDGVWTFFQGVEVRSSIRKGFDCRRACEHVPPRPNRGQTHGQHADEYHFAARSEHRAGLMICYSRIQKGRIVMPDSRMPLVFGAYVSTHVEEGTGLREECHLLKAGFCYPETKGLIFAGDFFDAPQSALVEKLLLREAEAVDLDAVTAALAPFWPALIETCEISVFTN